MGWKRALLLGARGLEFLGPGGSTVCPASITWLRCSWASPTPPARAMSLGPSESVVYVRMCSYFKNDWSKGKH